MQAVTPIARPEQEDQNSQEACQPATVSLFGIPLQLSARSIALFAGLCGTAWVVCTTQLLEQHELDRVHVRLHLGFGFIFVSAATWILYVVVHRFALDLSCTRNLVRRVFDASPSSIVVFNNQNRKILLANHSFAQMTGYSPDRLTGQSDATLGLWENSDERLALMRQLYRHGKSYRFETSFRHADGSQLPVEITARSIHFDRQPCTIAFIDDISRQQEAARKVEELTRFDSITGLPNQKLLVERLGQQLAVATREEQGLAVLLLAMNRCPCAVMATGHDACDELLRAVAMRLKEDLRQTDTLAVLQQGEFAILLPKAASEREIVPILTKLLDCINEPFYVAESEYQLHAHIGVATFPGDGRTGELLLQQARLALNQAQTAHAGESFFQFYAEELNQLASEQMQIESSILKGLRAGEFFACYQPIFDREGTRIVGMEALARWQHPTLGLVGPDKFIPVAEANGAIVQLGERMLELALQNCRYWRDHGHPHLTVSVNISTRQLKDRQFADRVARQLQLSGLPPQALCCELTESLLMEHSNENTEQIFRLKELGIKLAIDDFGTGYSSLTYLKHLPVDYLKVDRAFVRDLENNPDDRAIVTAIVAMARSLHLKVTAEGVETSQQHRLLQELGCDTMQGYLFGKPVTRAAFDLLLQEGLQQPVVDEPPPEKTAPQLTGYHAESDTVAHDERSLQNVADITLHIEPLKPSDRLNTALERFQRQKELQVLPVVDQHRVVGILNRSEFIEEQIVGRIGYAFHINHSKKVRNLMQPVPMVIDSEASIEEAAQTLHGNSGSMRLENICVTSKGIYLGVLDVRTLVEAITALNLKLAKGANPLTGLPGNESIQRETTRRLESGMPFDIAYIDIDNFKPYNDFYGFERGDMVIQMVGEILKRHTGDAPQAGLQKSFCGHIGGDDFIIITGPGIATLLCQQLINEFEARLPVLHGSCDCAKGCYTSFNRYGELETFSLLSLSSAIISTGRLRVDSYAQLASMASDVKKTAKKVKGSSIVKKDSNEPPACISETRLKQD